MDFMIDVRNCCAVIDLLRPIKRPSSNAYAFIEIKVYSNRDKNCEKIANEAEFLLHRTHGGRFHINFSLFVPSKHGSLPLSHLFHPVIAK